MKKETIVVVIDSAKAGRAESREIFKGSNMRGVTHRSRKDYSRKEKHRAEY